MSASSYLSADLKTIHAHPKQWIRWGYFPEFIPYTLNQIFEMKANPIPIITWVGRLIDWKHPEHCLYIADRLRSDKIEYQFKIIGTGPLEGKLKDQCKMMHLEQNVEFIGSIDYRSVRDKLAHSNVFIFTSDYNEGWGAVLNEAMNAGCAVVVNEAIGSAPILVEHQARGYLYSNNDLESLYGYAKNLILNPELAHKMGIAAYDFIHDHYNSHVASQNLIDFFSGSPVYSDIEPGCPFEPKDVQTL